MLAQVTAQVVALEKLYAGLVAKVDRAGPTELRAEVDKLLGRIEQLATANRSEFGRLWQKLRGESPEPGLTNGAGDAEFQAFLQLQR